MRILLKEPSEIKNPWEGEIDFHQNVRLATKQGFNEGKQAVLDQMVEVDPALLRDWLNRAYELRGNLAIFGYPSLEDYLKEQLEERNE